MSTKGALLGRRLTMVTKSILATMSSTATSIIKSSSSLPGCSVISGSDTTPKWADKNVRSR